MKFLLSVLAIHFIAQLRGKITKEKKSKAGGQKNDTRHPAEFDLR